MPKNKERLPALSCGGVVRMRQWRKITRQMQKRMRVAEAFFEKGGLRLTYALVGDNISDCRRLKKLCEKAWEEQQSNTNVQPRGPLLDS